MKKAVVAATLALASISAMAADNEVTIDLCATLSETAALSMKARQLGLPMDKLVTATYKMESSKRMKDYTFATIRMAYALPRFTTADYQQEAITDFKDKAFSQCLDELL